MKAQSMIKSSRIKILLSLNFAFLFTLPLTGQATEGLVIPHKFEANFNQVFKKLSDGKESKSSGKISYFYPGKVRVDVLEPAFQKLTFVSNGKQSWYYTPPFDAEEKGEVVIRPSKKLPIVSLLDLLVSEKEFAKKFEVKKSSGTEIVLNVKPDSIKKIGLKTVRLHGDKVIKRLEDLTSIDVVYEDDREIVIKFVAVTERKDFPESTFNFVVPPRTNVLDH
jgi:outer membrane lipoprotein-sorting protein